MKLVLAKDRGGHSSEHNATVVEQDSFSTEPSGTVVEADPLNAFDTDPSATVVESDRNASIAALNKIARAPISSTPLPTFDSQTPTPTTNLHDFDSRVITAESARSVESAPPPTAEPASNPEPTVATKLDPGVTNLVSGTLVGEYVIERLLGSGAMGQVYGGQHEQLGKRVAIKVIAPSMSKDRDAIERFHQEAIALARLSHPNIVSVLSVGTLPGDGRSYYVMEWLDGESLQTRLDRKRLTFDDALDIVDQIARGLESAHAAGTIHRDLKPDNIWLQRIHGEARPVVKILDFGLAKLAHHRRTEHTATNVMFGTPQFMSPEQCRSARDVGPPTDVYALGCVMFELLCGRLPFVYDNFAELTVAHLGEEPPHPRALNPAIDQHLDALLFAMLAKDPSRRPTLAAVRSTTAESRRRLHDEARQPHPDAIPRTPMPHHSSSTITAPRAATAVPAPRPRSRLIPALVGTLVLLSVVLVAVIASSNDGATSTAIDASVASKQFEREALGTSSDAAAVEASTSDVAPADAGAASAVSVDAGTASAVTAGTLEASPPGRPTSSPRPNRTTSSASKSVVDERKGFLTISSKPSGAKISIDGIDTGWVTPITKGIALAPGKHEVMFTIGTNRVTFVVNITAGKTLPLFKELGFRTRIPSDQTFDPFKKKPQ